MTKSIKKYNNLIISVLTAVFLALAIFQVAYNIDKPSIKIWDEASSATNAIEMLETGSYWIVLHDGKPTHAVDSLPPLNLWTKVVSYKIFGINEFGVRFPSIMAALIIMLVFIRFGNRFLKNHLFTIIALFLIATTKGFNVYHVIRNGDPEALLLLFVSIYFLVFFVILERYPRKRIWYLFILGASVFFAMFTKSVAGLAPLAGIFVYALFQKNTYLLLKDYRFHLTWMGALALFASYYLIREQYDPGYIREGFLRELGLFDKASLYVKHPEKDFYFTYLMKVGFYPYFYMIPLSLIVLLFGENKRAKKLIIYALSASIFFVLGHSMAVTKNEWYISPIYPFLWALMAITYAELISILHRFISHKVNYTRIAYPIAIILILFFYRDQYLQIFKANEKYKSYTYHLEREGTFYRDIKLQSNQYKNITIISKNHPRQMKFYTRKYHYLYGDNTQIIKSPNASIIGDTVLVCMKEIKKEIDSGYKYSILEEDKYCKLIYIESKK